MNKNLLPVKKRLDNLTIQRDLNALCDLSNTPRLTPASLSELIHESPDPETAVRTVYSHLPANSPALRRKWRQLLTELWSARHQHLPTLLNLPIAASDVIETIALQDALAFLHEIAKNPAPMVKESSGEWLLSSNVLSSLLSVLPSSRFSPIYPFENEWQVLPLRRLHSMLESIRLVRRHRGHLVVVRARYERLMSLPAIQQYYLLWHADAYHVDWASFAGLWSDYLRLIQEYVPLLWNISDDLTSNTVYDLRAWNQSLWETFMPLWEQEGLLANNGGQKSLLALVRLHSVPTAITQIIMFDLFSRYGLVNISDQRFIYTPLGISILSSEHNYELPCALDLLQ